MERAFGPLLVDDMEAAERFYVDVLDFSIVREWRDRTHFRRGSTDLVAPSGYRPAAPSVYGENVSSTLIFVTDDTDEKTVDMQSKGVRFLHESPGANDLGRYAAFLDPPGIVHEILERPDPIRANACAGPGPYSTLVASNLV